MDEKDHEIIRLLQKEFPIVSEPWKAIGDKLWIDERSVISRMAYMLQNGAIRYVGAFFDSRKLGYSGVLAALDVIPEDIETVSKIINQHNGVTHNYLREGNPNIWFTLIAKNKTEQGELIAQIEKQTGYEVKLFPAKKLFKVHVNLD